MRAFVGIKPQDILLLLKLIASPGLSQNSLSLELEISQAEISHGLKRLKASALLNAEGQPHIESCLEFLVHGLRYVFPPQFGTPSIGIPTAFAHPEFKYVKYDKNQIYIWPYAEGKIRGIALLPIYDTFPQACLRDEKLYKIASLIEMLRAGKSREKTIAFHELESILSDRSEKKLNGKKRHSP